MISPDSVIVITTTVSTKDQAAKIAQSLIEARLAACVQTSGPITSVYRWHGAIETAEEWLCTAKTTFARYAELEQAIRALHPYEQPEIIAVAAVAGDEGYIRWVRDEVGEAGDKDS